MYRAYNLSIKIQVVFEIMETTAIDNYQKAMPIFGVHASGL